MIQAGWSLLEVYNEDKVQFMVGGTVTTVLDNRFTVEIGLPQNVWQRR